VAYLGNDLQVAFPTYRNIDDISGSFNGVTTSFPLTVDGVAPIPAPVNSQQCLISVNGVVQRPDDSGAEGFLLSGGNIVFASAPAGGVDFFGVILAGADYINIGANFPSGTALVPSITFDSDLDTGIYNPAGNQIGFTTAGVQRLVINSSGQVSGGLGSATTPAFSFLSDPNTGIYSPGADQVAVATNGTGRLFVSDNGVATGGAPQSGYGALQVRNSFIYLNEDGADTTQMYLRTVSNEAAIQVATNHPFKIQTNNQERLRITSAGLVGIGTSAPVELMQLRGSGATKLLLSSADNTTDRGVYFGTSDNTVLGYIKQEYSTGLFEISSGSGAYTSGIGFRTGGVANRVFIDSAGRVGIGTTSPGSAFEVKPSASSATLGIQAGTINTDSIRIQAAGTANTYLEYRGYLGHAWFVDATERARIDSSGRLLVGTSTSASAGGGTNIQQIFSSTNDRQD
jgi:hypothetical protein